MLIYETNKTEARKIVKAMEIIGLNVKSRIIELDFNLYKLGFVNDIPCRLEIFSTTLQEEQMLDFIDDLEISAYVDNDTEAEAKYQQLICLQNLLLLKL